MPFVFDAYGTLFDVHAAIARHRAAAGPDADRFSEIWRAKQLEYTWTNTLAGRYADFWTLTQQALDYSFARVPSVDRSLRDKLLDAYMKLDAFPDARDALRDLKARGERTAILSNGSPAMLEAAVAASGLKDLLDAVLSVDGLRLRFTRWPPRRSPSNPRRSASSLRTAGTRWAPRRSALMPFGLTGRTCLTSTRHCHRPGQ
jgi:2-haloacid dehalogenase